MAIGKDIMELQKDISYNFSDLSLLETALTHSSFSNDRRAKGINPPSNERLEFLGDAVLELVISECLFFKYPSLAEGSLTKMRQHLVCEKTLSKMARRISLGEYINLGRGEEASGLRSGAKILADALEALIAAIYLDSASIGSQDSVKEFVLRLFGDEIKNSENMQGGDYKTMLQQIVEKDGAAILEYKIVAENGPDHNKTFDAEAYINNNRVGKGRGVTKKDAEMAAAKEALLLFGVEV